MGTSPGANDYVDSSWTNKNIYLTLNNDATDGHSGVASTVWKVDEVEISGTTTTLTEEGEHTIEVQTTDKVGNVSDIRSYTVKIDYDNPTLTVDPPSCNWRNSALSVTVTHNDTGGSGVTSTSGEYFLTTSSSPEAVPVESYRNGTYTSGTAFYIDPGTSGEYYLWIKQISDSAGNKSSTTDYVTINGVVYHRYGPYKFDYDNPTLTVDPPSCNWRNSALSVTVGHKDTGGSGLETLEGEYFLTQKDNSSPTEIPTESMLKGTYETNNGYGGIIIDPGTSGEYYLWIKQISDGATNKSDTTPSVTIGGVTYHRYGLYQFDYDLPEWEYVSKDIYLTNPDDVGNVENYDGNGNRGPDQYANAARTVVITFKGKDATSKITSTLDIGNDTNPNNDIAISVNGTPITSEITKTLSTDSTSDKEIVYTLTLKGITGDGTLEVVIPAGTLTDQATNTNVSTNIATDITIDNTPTDITDSNISFAVTSPVTIPETENYYKAGTEIIITATYNEDIYKEITSNTLITTANPPTMTLKFGGATSKNEVECTPVSGRVFTYRYIITGPTTAGGTDGDNGTMTISMETVFDRAGNAISVSGVTLPSVSIIADTIEPKVESITADQPVSPYTATNAENITYTVRFSEVVKEFTASDITVNSGYGEVTSVTSSNGTEKDTTWLVVVSTTDNQEYTETITVKANENIIDRAENKVPTPPVTSDGIVVDRIDPTVTSITPNVTSPTNAENITYTVVFSENVTGFVASDITVNSGYGEVTSVTSSNGTGNDTTWIVVVSTTDDVEYTETITIKANGTTIDKAGNKVSEAKTSDVLVVDRIDPTWTYVSKDIYLTNPDDVGNVEDYDGNGNRGPDQYTNAERKVVIVFKGTDANGHNVTSSLDFGQDGNPNNDVLVSVNGTSLAYSNMTLVTTNNGTSEVTCTLTITGITGDGTLDVQIPSGTLTDEATNTNTLTNITTSVNITIDNTKPTVSFAVTSPVTIPETENYYKAGQVITITATYSDTNIGAGIFADQKSTTPITTENAPAMSLAFGNTDAQGDEPECIDVDGNVLTYAYTIKGPTTTGGTDGDNGILKITSLGTVYDAAGNIIESPIYPVTPSPEITADTIAPTLTIEQDKTSWTNAETITYTFTFSENVTGFTAAGITLTSTQSKASKGIFSGSGSIYTLEVNIVDGYTETVTVSVPAGVCTDLAILDTNGDGVPDDDGNENMASSPLSINVDRIDPTITVDYDKTTNAIANNYQKSQSVTITVEDEGAGLLPSNTYQYFLSSSETALVGGAWVGGTWTGYDHTGVTPITIGEGLTGDYYLFIKTVQDNVTDDVKNESTTDGDIEKIDGCHMFGIYKFDNTNPYWEKGIPNIDYTNKKVTVDIIGKDSHSGYGANTLDIDDIEVWVEGTKITNVTKHLSTATTVTEGIKYTLTLTNFEEVARQTGKNYKEWSGSTKIVVAADTLEDNLANKNTSDEYDFGHVDIIDPEFTYQYSETVIDKTNKKLTVVFYAADKYLDGTNSGITLADFYNPNTDSADALTTKPVFAVDGEPININVTGNSLTPETLDSGKTIKYTLVVANLQEKPSVEENNLNDGYKYSGIVSISIPADKFKDTSNNGNRATTITVGVDGGGTLGMLTPEYTKPYLPAGYTHVTGTDLSNGLTIQDSLGNQYVWIEVPTNLYDNPSYNTETTTGDKKPDSNEDYDDIEYCLHKYTATYRNGTDYKDIHSGNDASTGLTSTEYTELKQKMLKSVYENGGFYVGKYETGIADTEPDVIDTNHEARITEGTATQTPVIQANAYPYNYVSNKQAQELAESFKTEGYETSLLFGVQWDLVLKHLETKEFATVSELNSDSTEWGNYNNNTYTTNANGKYATETDSYAWTDGSYNKTQNGSVLLSTGASTEFERGGIYDFAGNVFEWTLEYTSDTYFTCVFRGGTYFDGGSNDPASNRDYNYRSVSNRYSGFRVSLYEDVDLNPDSEELVDGTIVDVVDPVWKLNHVSLEDGVVKIQATDKYFDTCTINKDDITIFVNNQPSTAIVKDITSTPVTNKYDTVNGVENTLIGKEYTLRLSNITPEDADYQDFDVDNIDELDESTRDGSYKYEYKAENGGNIQIQIAAGTITDKSGNSSVQQKFDIGTIDITKPEVYVVRKTQNPSANTETIVFNVTDRNYNSTDLVEKSEITLWIDNVQIDDLINNSTLTSKEIWGTPFGTDVVVKMGHQYTLVIPNIAQTVKQSEKNYLEYSGTLKITIAENAARDLNENTLNTNKTTITDFVDFIKPQIEQVTKEEPINISDKTYTMSFNVIDKYLYDSDMITEDEITIYVDGEEASSITKSILNPPTPITATMNKTVDGVVTSGTYTIGYTYTLVLGGFEQNSNQYGKGFMEWSGTVKAVIAQNATRDTKENTLDADEAKRTLIGEHVDFIKPVLEKVSSERGTNNETIIFNVMDKYLADSNTDVISTSEITVYVDGEAVTVDYTNSSSTGLDGVLTKVKNFKATVNGNSSHIVGQQYKLVLSGFEQSTRNAKEYKDYSGTVTIEMAQTAVEDTKGNRLDTAKAKRTVKGDFVDFIKPQLEYTHSSGNIDHGTKTYTMTFDITDKYYYLPTSGEIVEKIEDGSLHEAPNETTNRLTLDDLTITIQSDDNKIHDLKALALQGKVNIAFSSTEKTATFRKTVGEEVEETSDSHIIGHTYTLTISNLDQLEIANRDTDTTVNYSGVITVVVAQNQISDTGPAGDGETPNQNVETVIVSGVNVPDGSGSGTVVDVVSPVFNKVSSSAFAKQPTDAVNATAKTGTATITFKATDRYFVEGSGITESDIQVVVDGSVVSTGITKSFTDTEELTEDRIVNGVPQNDVQYGVQYTLKITGWVQNAKQVKIRIPADKLIDQYENKNIVTDMIIYNCLEQTSLEVGANSGFLDGNGLGETVAEGGSGPVTGIERQDIEQVIFVNSLAGSRLEGVKKVWDVSAMSDGSIKAWTSQESAPYTVYIGSDDEIFANQDASYLFAYIGYSESCTATQTVIDLNYLNTSSVTNMNRMFMKFGYRAMTSLNLGEFDTANVTGMTEMFECDVAGGGHIKLGSFNLGTKFDTANVESMVRMFLRGWLL